MLNGFGLTQQNMLKGLVHNQGGMTIEDIVKSLKITRTAVNQHMNSLEKDGYVEKHALMKTRGRPGQSYRLSNKGIHLFPKQYAWFSELLLRTLKEKLGSEGLENVLRELGEKVAEKYSSRLDEKSATKKIGEIVAIMRELGYESDLHPEGKDIISACNCVYHDLAIENHEVCSFDLALLSIMSGRKIEHVECMVRGGNKCRFKIKEALKTPHTSDYQIL